MAEVLGNAGCGLGPAFRRKSFSYCNLQGQGALQRGLQHGLSLGATELIEKAGPAGFVKRSRDDEHSGLKRSVSDKCLLHTSPVEEGQAAAAAKSGSAADSVTSVSTSQPMDHSSIAGSQQAMSRKSPGDMGSWSSNQGLGHGAKAMRPSEAQAGLSLSDVHDGAGSPHAASSATSMHSFPVSRVTVERAGTALNISPTGSRAIDSRILLGMSGRHETRPEPAPAMASASEHRPASVQAQPSQYPHPHHHHQRMAPGPGGSLLGPHAASMHAAQAGTSPSGSGGLHTGWAYRRSRTVEVQGHSLLVPQQAPNMGSFSHPSRAATAQPSSGWGPLRASHDSEAVEDSSSSDDDESRATTRMLTEALKASNAVSRSNHQRNHSWNPSPFPSGMGSGGGGGGGGRSTALLSNLAPSTGPSTPRSTGARSHERGSGGDEENDDSKAHGGSTSALAPHHRMQLPPGGDAVPSDEGPASAAAAFQRQRTSYHLTSGQAALELFLRLSRARQTLDFVKRQASQFAALDHGEMGVWEALHMLNELREYEAALMGPGSGLDPDMPLLEHAFQAAELCRAAHPDREWLHLAGLLHGLGKLLAHRRWGSQPQWAVCGESFPVGCRFDTHIAGAQFFLANPDRRRRACNTPTGVYQPRCGLRNVFMSWGAQEYLYLVLVLNNTALPPEALFMLRFAKFQALVRPGGAYAQLLSPEDEALLPLLHGFQRAITYRRVEVPGTLSETERFAYYDALIKKYIPGKLLW